MRKSSGTKRARREPNSTTPTAPASGAAEQENNLKAFCFLLDQFGRSAASHDLLKTIAETVLKQCEGVLAEIWQGDRRNGQFVRCAVACGPGLSAQTRESQISPQYAGRLRGLPETHRGSPFPELPPELASGPPPAVLLAQPIELSGSALGLLTLYRAKEAGGSSLHWFRAFTGVAGLALDRSRLMQESGRSIAQLQSVVEASKVLHSTLDLEELLELILKLATSEIGADRGTVFLVDQQARELWSLVALGLQKQEIRLPFGRGVAGHVAETGEVLNISEPYQDPLFDPSFDERFGYRSRNILCLPIRNNRGEVLGVLQLINKKTGEFQQEDIDILDTLSIHMALALENAQRHRELLAKQRMEKELALARGIQRSLLPVAPPVVPGYDIAVLHEPCFEVGGDYYDFLSLGSHTLLLVVADVEGKGVSSALIMSNLQASLRTLAMNLHSLEVITRSLNDMIREDTRSQKFLSIFLGLIDTQGQGLHYINAGHVPPVVVRASGEVVSLESGGIVIGLFDSPEYSRGNAKLLPGDVLVFCTDGITEADDPTGEEYGTDRLVEFVRKNRHRSAQELVDFIVKDVQEFSRGGTHSDDRILMVVKVQQNGAG